MKALLILLALFALPANAAFACSPPMPFPERDARDAESIQIGKIVGERWIRPASGTTPRGRTWLLALVEFNEALKGKLTEPREVIVPCAEPLAIGERVFVIRHVEGDYLVPGDFTEYEQTLRNALASGR